MRPSVNESRAILVVILIASWQLFADVGLINVHLLSSPLEIGSKMWLIATGHSDIPDFTSNLIATITELLIAYGAIIAIGVPFGLALGWNKFFGATFEPLIIAFFSIPSIVLYPVIYLIFGLGTTSKIVFGILVGLFVVVENSVAGARQMNPDFVKVGTSLGFSKLQIFRKMVIPAALPSITTGLRLGISMTLIGIIAGEIIASSVGLGRLVSNSFSLFRTGDLMTLIVIIVAISTVGNLALALIERRASRFRLVNVES